MIHHKATTAVYAMKIIDKEGLSQQKAVSDAHTEHSILAMVSRTNALFIISSHADFQTSCRA